MSGLFHRCMPCGASHEKCLAQREAESLLHELYNAVSRGQDIALALRRVEEFVA